MTWQGMRQADIARHVMGLQYRCEMRVDDAVGIICLTPPAPREPGGPRARPGVPAALATGQAPPVPYSARRRSPVLSSGAPAQAIWAPRGAPRMTWAPCPRASQTLLAKSWDASQLETQTLNLSVGSDIESKPFDQSDCTNPTRQYALYPVHYGSSHPLSQSRCEL
jgi:hypothetical protein